MKNSNDFYSEFGYYIHQIVTLIDKRGDEMFRAKLGISLRQFLLLRLIEVGAPSQQLLADRLSIAKSAISRQIDIARNKGWVEVSTSSASRRQNTLVLTSFGQELLVQAKMLIAQSEVQGFGDMPIADVEATVRTLKTLHKKLLL
jgi:DNA-binding MarR family transcriptional regulator